MNRRTFLKAVGVAVALPALATRATALPVVTGREVLTVARMREAMESLRNESLNSKKLAMYIHPDQVDAVRMLAGKYGVFRDCDIVETKRL